MSRQPKTDRSASPFTRPRRLASFTAIGMMVLFLASFRSSQADFEIPLVDTTGFVPGNFRSVWGFLRDSVIVNRNDPETTASTSYKHYQAWAVGEATDVADTGMLYGYGPGGANVMAWRKVNSRTWKVGGNTWPVLNAVVGQGGPGNAMFWVAGSKPGENPRIFYNPNQSYSIMSNDFSEAKITNNNTKQIYSLGAYQGYHEKVLAGGEDGTILTHTWYVCGHDYDYDGCTPEEDVTDIPDEWNKFTFAPAANVPRTDGNGDDILGIIYPSPDVAYVVTTDLQKGVSPNPGISPFNRPVDCSGLTGKLFEVSGNPAYASSWKLLNGGAGVPNACFFGLSAGVKDESIGSNGPLASNIWIAAGSGASDGKIYRYNPVTDQITADFTSAEKQLYAVSAIPDRGGDGQNLLYNGTFDAWSIKNPGTSDQAQPAGYKTINDNQGINNSTGKCGPNRYDVSFAPNPPDHTGNPAVKIEPAVYYESTKCTSGNAPDAGATQYRNATASVVGRVDLSTIEGETFKISGDYRVDFANPPNPVPTKFDNSGLSLGGGGAQGGVVFGCEGANPHATPAFISSSSQFSTSLDCSFSNRSLIKTDTGSHVGTGGWVHFEKIVSRADILLMRNGIIKGGQDNPRTAGQNLVFTIRCEATYGARVWCDNFSFSQVNQPPIGTYDRMTVLAVGQDGLALVNHDAFTAPGTFVDEGNLLAGPNLHLNSISAVGIQHVYTVGQSSQIFQRAPSNISGYIWNGSASEGGDAKSYGLGWLSSSCVNEKESGLSLCQRVKSSYGLYFRDDSLAGRAWYGKQFTGVVEEREETIDLGTCLNPARRDGLPASEPYRMGYGICISSACTDGGAGCTIANEALNCQKSCDTITRTCFKNTQIACLRDFDCYGRCSKDEGFRCLTDNDCRAPNLTSPLSNVGSPFISDPAKFLSCEAGKNPNACTAAGWLSFDASDFVSSVNHPAWPGLGEPNDGIAGVGTGYNSLTGGLYGWGRFITYATSNLPATDDPNASSTTGWVRIRGQVTNPVPSNQLYGCQMCAINSPDMSCTFCQDALAQSCRPKADSCTYYCDGDPTKTPCLVSDTCTDGKSCEPVGYCSRERIRCNSDIDCTAAATPSHPNAGYCNFGAVCEPQAVGSLSCNKWGVDIDSSSGKFYGYAWSSEYGWLDFHRLQLGVSPYLQTRLGDIYAQKQIGGPQILLPPGSTTNCNATYLITSSNSITNFCSALADSNGVVSGTTQNAPLVPLGTTGNIYQNILGRFDLVGLETDVNPDPVVYNNKYGMEIVNLSVNSSSGVIDTSSSFFGLNSQPLKRKVYIAACPTVPSVVDCVIDSELAFANGTLANPGNGLLIVKGNLKINKNMSYVRTSITDLRQLASLVVVVKGNLTISNTVTNVVGAYYVIDNPATTGGGEIEGKLSTTSDDANNRYPLTARGLFIAREFHFGRRFAGTLENPLPSELIIYDGRLQSNPLPGTIDFVNALPSTLSNNN